MAKLTINVGSSANSGGGDALRDAMVKINSNFDELYNTLGSVSALEDGQLRADIQGSIFADDSTLLVDAVNGIIPASVISGNLDLSGSTIPFASVTSTPTTLAGYGITDALSSSISAADITGYGVFTGTEEAFDTLTGATGTVTHDCDNGHIFYHTGAAADWTANFTNLGLTAEHATTLSIVIDQGATAYIPTAVEIGGVAQTILWQGGSAPSGTANGTDVVAFSILNDGGTYVVMGQLVGFS